MKLNPIDAVINFFDPAAGLNRTRARMTQEVMRSYDISSMGRRNEGWNRPQSKGRDEVSKAVKLATASAQELGRNNPLANRIKRVWASNAVGGGIQLDVLSKNDEAAKKMQESYDDWFETTTCDFEGHYNGDGLQWLWITTIVESGGVFIIKKVKDSIKFPLQLQTLEQTQLDRSKDGEFVVDGVEYKKDGSIKGYWFIVDKTLMIQKPVFIKARDVVHMFRKERVGQHLGMTWLAAVATTLRNYDTMTDAKLMQQQIAALFALIVEDADSNLGLNKSGITTDGTHESPDELEPGMVYNMKQGSTPHTITPPKADNSSNFDIGIKRDISVGSGITYEQLTGDYSLVNFASGRMGRSEFYTELDYVQKLMMKPGLDKIFGWFSTIYQIKNGTGQYTHDWTFPPRAAVNPQEEFDVIISKVRNGMLSPSKAAKILGERFEKVVAQWKKDKTLFGDLPFDFDPSKFASTGNQLDDNDAASSNNVTEPKTKTKLKDKKDV